MGGNDELDGNSFSSGRVYLGPLTYRLEPAGTVPSVTSDIFYLENADSECGRVVVLRRKTANGQSVTTNFTTLFSVSDHLGSTRAVMDAAGNILERNAYYPFGLQTDQGNAFPEISSSLTTLYPRYINSSSTRRDLYNGKEIQTIAGTDYLDYGFRQYDPMTGRWMAVDPKAEKYLSMSPYSYCAGNSIDNVDSIGMNWYTYKNRYGYNEYFYFEGQLSKEEINKNNYIDLGLTYTDNDSNKYYSLFGKVLNIRNDKGLDLLETLLYKKIDDLLIKSNLSEDHSGYVDFYFGLEPGEYSFSYGGNTFMSKKDGTRYSAYNNRENSILHIAQMPPLHEKRYGGLIGGVKHWQGCFLVLKNKGGFDAIQINFNRNDAERFRQAVNNLFKNLKKQ